ncbi:MAG: Na(+)-translocating NADH-quinone reductase subunit C [Planctomycetota bacterium]|jgi:Na+-transporting NADH:ubiquinone oxidoreductase subunit C
MARETTSKTVLVALALAVVCSLLVSTAAVVLRPMQEENKLLEKQKNILMAAGLYDEKVPIADAFEAFEPKIVNLETGAYVPATEVDPQAYDQREAAGDPARSVAIGAEEDVARIGRRAKYALIYLVKTDGQLDQLVLPIVGKGLWSTMYGFLSLDKDGETVRGVTFYEHGETAGLGGEVSNPLWNAKWVGKKIYGDANKVAFAVIKGQVVDGSADAIHHVDGLSGSTLTSDGVTNLMHYWLGEQGFGPFLERIRKGGGNG